MKIQIPAVLFIILIFNCASWAFAESQDPDVVVQDAVLIEAGEFEMGDTFCADEQGNGDWCSDETPHQVQLGSYRIDKYEVTNADYRKCFVAGECSPHPLHEDRPQDFDQPNQPVVFVTWKDADGYCKWRGGRLPTEAEWERAAQGKDLGGAHFGKPYGQGMPQDIGQAPPNSNGLFDMMGNVNEWTQDWYGTYETVGIASNPSGPESGKDKVLRGGSWNSPSHFLRPSDRVARSPELRYSDVGFRCVYPLSEKG